MSQPQPLQLSDDSHPTRQLLRLAVPIIGVTVSRMLMGFIDFAMVSKLGTEAQAAISPAGVIVFSVLCLGMGLASTVQTFASQADGRGEPEQGSAYAWQALYIAVGAGLFIWPITLAVPGFFEVLGRWGGHEPAVIQQEIEYTRIALWSFTPSVVCAALMGFFNGIQRPIIGLVSIIISIVFNIVGNYALIFGNFGFEAMGIRGAAIATALGWWIRAGVLVVAFCSPTFDVRYKTRSMLAFSRDKLVRLMRVGAPASIHWILDIGSWAVFLILIMPIFGVTAMAASNIGLQFMHMSFMPAIGLAMAMATQVGFAIGEGRPDIAAQRVRSALMLTMAYMSTMGAIMFLFRRPLIGLLTDDPAVIEAGAVVLTWAAIFQVSDALCVTYTNALRGAGDTKWPAVYNGAACWVVFVGGGFAVSRWFPQLGLAGPWIMTALYIWLLGGALWLRFRHGAWRSIKLFDIGEDREAIRQDAPAAVPATAAANVGDPS